MYLQHQIQDIQVSFNGHTRPAGPQYGTCFISHLPPKSLKVALQFSENLWTPGLDILHSKNLLVSASYIVEYRIPCLAGSSLVKDVEGFN